MNRKAIWIAFALAAWIVSGGLALRMPSRLLANAFFSTALSILTFAILGALFRSGRARAFWAGFSLGGSLYLVLACMPIFDTHVGVHLLTTPGLDMLYEKLAHRPPTNGPYNFSAWNDWSSPHLNYDRRYVGNVVMVSSESFMRIGHSVIAIPLAMIGGVTGRKLAAGR